MGKVTQRMIAQKVGIGAYFLNHILNSRKPCPPYLAVKLENATGIDRTVWVWGSREEKRTAWLKFQGKTQRELPELTKWLHRLYSGMEGCCSIKVGTIRILSGAESVNLVKFQRMLRDSLNELVESMVIKSWKIDQENNVVIIKR